jgi:hypothetical protein
MRLDDKVALITGAASGMGASMARIFARERAKVVVADVLDDEGRRVAADITQANGAAIFRHLDVTNGAEWKAAIDATVAEFGKLDILVNDAGLSGSTGLGQALIGGKSTSSPWYSASDLVQISFIAAMRSRINLKRVLNAVPWSSISSAFHPPPIPNRNRPPEIWSIEATSFAVWIGSRCATRHTPVPIFNVLVAAAAAVSVTNGSIAS